MLFVFGNWRFEALLATLGIDVAALAKKVIVALVFIQRETQRALNVCPRLSSSFIYIS